MPACRHDQQKTVVAQGSNHKPGSVRIIGGIWRSRRIRIADGLTLRPTPDRVRETLFNWLGTRLAGARCLDLFAGTGALGFEALSRGASRAVLVESDAATAEALHRHQRELGATVEIICADAGEYLSRSGIGPFDIVFVDPPYSNPVTGVLEALVPALAPGARLYLERERGSSWPETAGFEWLRRATAAGVEYGLAAYHGAMTSSDSP